MRVTFRLLTFALLLCGSVAHTQEGPEDRSSSDDARIDLRSIIETMVPGEAPSASASDPDDNASMDRLSSLPIFERRTTDREAAPSTSVGTVFYPALSDIGAGVIRLSGEFAEANLTLDVPAVSDVRELRVSHRSSINVLPQISTFTVLLNGVQIANFSPDSFESFSSVTLPREELVEGQNQLVIRVSQSHRIFCGPEASFDIWTEINLNQTGIMVAAQSGSPDEANFRRALKAQLATGEPVLVVSTQTPQPDALAELSLRLSSLAPGLSPEIAVQNPFAPARTNTGLARITIVEDTATDFQIRRALDGTLVLILSDIRNLEALDGFLPRPAPIAGPGRFLPGSQATLADLGLSPISIRSRYSRTDVRFLLPPDWLLLASQKAELGLVYEYAAGLPQNALLIVKVNDTTVRVLPLFGQGGERIPRLPVSFPARLLAPGNNAISFETIIPGEPPNQPCPRIEGELLRVSDQTTLLIPPSPKMQFPDLGAQLLVLDPDRITAVNDGRVGGLAQTTSDALHVIFRPLANVETSASLAIAEVDQTDLVPMSGLGLSRQMVETILTPGLASTSEDARATSAQPQNRLVVLFWETMSAVSHLGRPGDPRLAEWVEGRHGEALLLMPDRNEGGNLWLIMAEGADPQRVAAAFTAARLSPDGPSGQLAVLDRDGSWQSWLSPAELPELLEPLSTRNIRTVAGNYASRSPLSYVAVVAILLIFSVIVALMFVVRNRGSRKR